MQQKRETRSNLALQTTLIPEKILLSHKDIFTSGL